MVEGVAKAREAGFEISVTVLLGLGGKKLSERHARNTAALLNKLRPDYIGALTLMLGPLEDAFAKSMGDDFEWLDKWETLQELRALVSGLELRDTVFRTNHASNWLPLRGVLNRDKEKILGMIDAALADRDGSMLRPAEWRAL